METLCVPGTVDSLPAVGEFVTRAARQASLDGHATYRLRLAVDEIATNSIVHGYGRSGKRGDLLLTAHVTAGKVTVVLQESSPPYDPRQTPPPDDLDVPPEKRPEGGLGIYLALRGVDAFHYKYDQGLNCHTFVMNRDN